MLNPDTLKEIEQIAEDCQLRPLPTNIGVGFTCSKPLPSELAYGYRHESTEHHHNYFVTDHAWQWPVTYKYTNYPRQNLSQDKYYVVDGFSPNLNKELHVGHLRNLALAASLEHILKPCVNAKFVALLGCSLGVKKAALNGWQNWTGFVRYRPEVYYDVVLPYDVVSNTRIDTDLNSRYLHCEVFDGPKGPVPVRRANGEALYAFYDLAFAEWVRPTHYITGHEQKEHFDNLGFGEKHLPMGLVLGPDGKKMKSRSGDALSADETMQMLMDKLEGDEGNHAKKNPAWNILAWNFLQVTRERNVKFVPENWVRADQGGMYITYTYARAVSALGHAPSHLFIMGNMPDDLWHPFPANNLKLWTAKPSDFELVGFAEQYCYYYNEAVKRLDPAPIANFAYDLARRITRAYEQEKIQGGRAAFVEAFSHATWRLRMCMEHLRMFPLIKV